MRKLLLFFITVILLSISAFAEDPLFFRIDTEYTDGSSVEIDIDVFDYASGRTIFQQKTNGLVRGGKLEFYLGLDTQKWYNIPSSEITPDLYVNIIVNGKPVRTNFNVDQQLQLSNQRLQTLKPNEYSTKNITANGRNFTGSMFGNSYNNWWIVRMNESSGRGTFTDNSGNIIDFKNASAVWLVKYNSGWYIIGSEERNNAQKQ